MSRSVVGWGFALALCMAIFSVGHAQAADPVAVQLSFRPIEPVGVGVGTTVIVDLRFASGPVLADEPVELSVDGVYYRRERTDVSGAVSFPIPNDLVAGEHQLSAFYPGRSNTYLTATATSSLEVDPYQLQVETVPALPGMAFTLDGERFEADAQGFARISVASAGDHVLIALDSEYANDGTTAVFARWTVNNEYLHQVTVKVPSVGPVQAGFDVFRPSSQAFVDPSGGLVEPDRITSFTLRSSLGQIFTYPDGRERVYKSSRVVRRATGLESVDVRYNVTDVQVDGSNVVNEGQQRFYATPGAVWRITLLLYSARIQAMDALFGFTAGRTVELTFPSGKSETFDVGSDGKVSIPWLARGIYRVAVANAAGWAPSMPVALSRDQDVELRVVSYLDMGIATLIGLIVVFGLLYRGRPHLIRDPVRAVGAGVSGLRLPSRGGQRPARDGGLSTGQASPAGTSPPPQLGQQGVEGRVKAAPILATIARRSDLDALDRVTVNSRLAQRADTPFSQDLIELAPSLFGPPADEAPPPAKRPLPSPEKRAAPAHPKQTETKSPEKQTAAARKVKAAPKGGKPKRAPEKAVSAVAVAPEKRAAPAHPKQTETKSPEKQTAAARKVKAAPKGGKPKRAPEKAVSAVAVAPEKRSAPAHPKQTETKSPEKQTAAARKVKAAPKGGKPKRAPEKAVSAVAVAPEKRSAASSRRGAPKRSARSSKRIQTERAAPAITAGAAGRGKVGSAKRAAPKQPAGPAPLRTSTGTSDTSSDRRKTARSGADETQSRSRANQVVAGTQTASMADEHVITEPTKTAEMQACRSCGLELWVDAQYCRRCGEPTVVAKVAEVELTPKGSRSTRGTAGRRSSGQPADPAGATPLRRGRE